MLKNILNLEGVAVLDKKQQKMISGGKALDDGCQVMTGSGNHMYHYVDGQVVDESCKWQCDGYQAWGGCPLLF